MLKKTSQREKGKKRDAGRVPNGLAGPGPVAKASGAKGVQLVTGKKSTAPTSADARYPRLRDSRMPAVGTVLVKRNRDGRACECTVEETGVRYGGTLYRSLSGAATAAAVVLGIKGRVNGFLFWGLIKAARPITNPGAYLRKIAGRYEAQAASLLKQDGSPAVRDEVRRELQAHAAHLTELLASAVPG